MIEKKLIERLIKFSNENQLINKGDKLLLAVSGGPDSIALLHLILKLKNYFRLQISVFHLNHCLRGDESLADEKFVRDSCDKLNIPCFFETRNISELAKVNKQNLEETARLVRYDLLNKTLLKIGYGKIVTGHTMDDNAESIIFNLTRGSGLAGVSGIKPKINNVIRPLLCISKSEILNYLNEKGISYRIDSTNSDTDYNRNLIRLKIVPLLREINPSLNESLLRFSSVISDYLNEIETIEKNFEELISFKNANLFLDITKNINYFRKIFSYFLLKKINNYFNTDIDYKKINAVINLISGQKGDKINIKKNLFAIREEGFIVIKKVTTFNNFETIFDSKNIKFENEFLIFESKVIGKENISINNNKYVEYIDIDKIKGNLVLRSWKKGEKMKPLGIKNRKLISKVLTDMKVNHSIRNKIAVLADEDNVIWLCGFRLSEDYKIDFTTKNALELKIEYKFELN